MNIPLEDSLLCLPMPMLIGFVLCVALLPTFIKYLRSKAIGQFVRADGPVEHAQKAHTPTAGGIVFLFAACVGAIAWFFYTGKFGVNALAVLLVTNFCGIIGLSDDLAKIANQDNRGISGRIRLVLEIAVGACLGLILLSTASVPCAIGIFSVPAWFYIVFAAFLLAATTNAVNLHDGMDGLAAGTTCQILATMGFMLYYQGSFELAAIAAAAAGATAGFLVFNRNPAHIFMGDTGSLLLGGLMAALALAGNLVLWFIPLALIYIFETLSVMAQVVYFKLTKPYASDKSESAVSLIWLKLTKKLPGEGKRLFRMAPLHHHFEAVGKDKGVKEWQIVAYFHVVQFLLCLLTIISFINVRKLLP